MRLTQITNQKCTVVFLPFTGACVSIHAALALQSCALHNFGRTAVCNDDDDDDDDGFISKDYPSNQGVINRCEGASGAFGR